MLPKHSVVCAAVCAGPADMFVVALNKVYCMHAFVTVLCVGEYECFSLAIPDQVLFCCGVSFRVGEYGTLDECQAAVERLSGQLLDGLTISVQPEVSTWAVQ